MKPLSEQSRTYLEGYKAAIEPSQLHIARQRRAVLQRVAEAGPAGSVASAPPPARRARRLAFAALLTVGAAAAAVLLMFGLREFVDLRVEHALQSSQAPFSSESPGAQRVERRARGRAEARGGSERADQRDAADGLEGPQPVASEVAGEVAGAASGDVALDSSADAAAPGEASAGASESPRSTRRRARARERVEVEQPPKAPVTQPARSVADLQAESALLARARVALSAGDTARARALLAKHARQHPDGLLVEERVVLQALTHCRAGDRDAGRASLRQLRRAFPGSLAAPRVSAACR